MHKLLRISISLLLSAFILLGGSGMSIGKMVCLKSGYTLYDVKALGDCCDDHGDAPVIRDKCCDISNVTFHQSHFLPENSSAVKAPYAVQLLIGPAASLFVVDAPVLSEERTAVVYHPARSGNSFQSIYRVFRI